MEIEDAYRRFFPVIDAKCRRMLGDGEESKDVAQETFTRLWKSGMWRAPAEQLVAWIYRTSGRLAIDALRRRRLAGALEPESAVAVDPSFESRQVLERLARSVPSRELEYAILSRVDGMTQKEIARVCGSSERSVRRLLARFDARIRQLGEAAA